MDHVPQAGGWLDTWMGGRMMDRWKDEWTEGWVGGTDGWVSEWVGWGAWHLKQKRFPFVSLILHFML